MALNTEFYFWTTNLWMVWRWMVTKYYWVSITTTSLKPFSLFFFEQQVGLTKRAKVRELWCWAFSVARDFMLSVNLGANEVLCFITPYRFEVIYFGLYTCVVWNWWCFMGCNMSVKYVCCLFIYYTVMVLSLLLVMCMIYVFGVIPWILYEDSMVTF